MALLTMIFRIAITQKTTESIEKTHTILENN